MDIEIIVLLIASAVCVYLIILRVFAALCGWNKLKETFPSRTYGIVFATYKNGISQIGRVDFAGKGRGKVSITDQGFLISMANPFMADILIPYKNVANVRTFSILGRRSVLIDIEHKVSLILSLPEESMKLWATRVKKEVFKEGVELDSLRELYDFAKDTLATPSAKTLNHVAKYGRYNLKKQ